MISQKKPPGIPGDMSFDDCSSENLGGAVFAVAAVKQVASNATMVRCLRSTLNTPHFGPVIGEAPPLVSFWSNFF